MKRVLALILALAMACVLFVGCDNTTDSGDVADSGSSDSGSSDSGSSDSGSSDSGSDKEVEEVYWFSSIGAYKALLEEEVAELE